MKVAASNYLDRLFQQRRRAWALFLLFWATIATAYTIAVTGAKIWIDSISYFQLALVLFDGDQLARLYQSEFGFFYQHVTPGLPFLIRVLDIIFHERLWPALAIIQGLLSAIAVTYFVLSFRDKLSRVAQLAAVLLCGLHPYFVGFHAAALTESVSSSILLTSIAIAIRALDGRLSLRASLTGLLPLSIAAAQFRPYLGVVGVTVAALVVFQLRPPKRVLLYTVCATTLAAGTLAFPVYRAALGAGFFMPNVNALLLTHVSYFSWDLDKETADSLKSVVLNDAIRERLIGRSPMDYDDSKHIFEDLIVSGASPEEARQRIAAAAWRIRTSSLSSIERQLQLPLASIGLQYLPTCCMPHRQVTRDLDAWDLLKHYLRYWRWNSGVNQGSYLESFDQFAEMTRSSKAYTEAAQEFYINRIRPYVTDALKSFRDPLRMRIMVTDPFFVMAWVGLFLCFWPKQRMTLLIIAVPFCVIYAAGAYALILGDNRYSHPLIPIIVVGAVKAVEDFFEERRWSRIPGFRRRS
jgi:hypothetical protein